MKNLASLFACCIILLVLVKYRATIPERHSDKPLNVTTWDAFGYYMYLPSLFIYHDGTQLNWLDTIDKKYAVTGGDGWQAQKLDNGNYVFKYLGGVAILEMPFFFAAHLIATHTGYPPDGFSPPYQYALGFGVLLYCFLALLLLRKILLRYFNDFTTALTLLLLCLATNFIQYAAVDNAQSHAYIFPLYVLVLFSTIQWHRHPRKIWAALTGFVIGLATMCRPTEAIMLFIPLLWNTHTKAASREKWKMVNTHRAHVLIAAFSGFLGVLPQLLYWKAVTGSFIYDVGSKWMFLNPWFRVLFGFEKGWFIYTPITLFFVIGLFFVKRFPFKNAAIWFCLLNIWIIISWSDWRYGGSYSTRALVQSYPVFALPLAAFISRVQQAKWRWLFYPLAAYLTFVNLFQTDQYNQNILHYNDMNRLYYSHIYLNSAPTPADMSLLDTDEMPVDEADFSRKIIADNRMNALIKFPLDGEGILLQAPVSFDPGRENWLKVEAEIKAPGHLWQSFLQATLVAGDDAQKKTRVRLFSPISREEQVNRYVFYIRVPQTFGNGTLKIHLSSAGAFEGEVKEMRISLLSR